MTKAEFHLDIAGLYDNKEITEQIAIEAMKQHAIEFAEQVQGDGWILMEAMKQHAIEFAEQVQGDGWILMGDSMWRNVVDPKIAEDDFRTTEQLYKRFNNQEP